MRVIQERIGELVGVGPDMVSYWIRGNVPEPERVSTLVHYCIDNGYVNYAWAQSLLTQAKYPNREQLLDELFAGQAPNIRIFITYNGNFEPDSKLAMRLQDILVDGGHNALLSDVTQTTWLNDVEQQTKAGDLLVVILSKAAADTEIMQEVISQADTQRQEWGWLRILPVRVHFDEAFPYLIENLLDPRQYSNWHDSRDTPIVVQEILAASEGRLGNKTPIVPLSERETVSVQATDVKNNVPPPLPQTDPRILAVPGGAVKLRDPLYIRRQADADLQNEILRLGSTTTIQAPRQTGKSSLLVRALHYARENNRKIVNLDMQTVGRLEQASPDNFMLYLAKFIARNLRLDLAEVDTAWQSSLGPQDKLTYLFEDYILPQCNTAVVLAIDEADRLLKTDYYQDFFSLVRSWHNKRALEEVWEMLNIILVISTEPYLLIREPHQSPFNVGLKIYLRDFDSEQISELNQRHGAPLQKNELTQLMTLLNGHPYLTRQAMYLLSANKYTWQDLAHNPIDDHGPFGDHLWRNYLLLQDEYTLQDSLREVIQHQRCTNEIGFTRLLRAGLIKGNIDACNFRCDLYKMYFERKLA